MHRQQPCGSWHEAAAALGPPSLTSLWRERERERQEEGERERCTARHGSPTSSRSVPGLLADSLRQTREKRRLEEQSQAELAGAEWKQAGEADQPTTAHFFQEEALSAASVRSGSDWLRGAPAAPRRRLPESHGEPPTIPKATPTSPVTSPLCSLTQ